ncbi:CCA tRNA nucleotidyltransferase, mitochondrial, partial [Ascosphaera atra]
MSHHNPGPTLPSSSAPTRERSHSPFKSSKRRKTSIQAHPGIVRDQEARKDENGESMAEPLPTITLTPLEATLRDLLLDVVEYINARKASQSPRAGRAPAEGLVLRFTGGWVRDKLLGVQSKDIDVGISSMTGLQFGLALKEYLDTPGNLDKYKKREGISGLGEDRIVSLHKISANPEKSKHLETVTTKIFGLDVDLVNLRKETYTEDSRNPQMEFGTPYEDAMRRDATVNAMFYNLNTASVEDFTGAGLQDMRERLIRTPLEPHQTFKDDPLRVLRLIRFSSRLGYKIDEETAEAMGMADIKEALKVKISPERVGVEVQKTLRGPDPLKALRFIDQHNLYNMIFINHADPIEADTSTWARVYESLRDLLNDEVDSISAPGSTIPLATRQFLRNHLVRADTENELYYAWLLAALAPWAVVPLRDAKGNVVPPTIKRPPQARVVAGQGMR